MSEPTLNRRLTSMDSTFLYFEKKEATMHIGSVSVFDGEIDFDEFVAMMEAKIHLLPRYQQVVVPDPFRLAHPTWEFAPDFDVRNHIFRLQIEKPGGDRELSALAGRIFTPMMDRGKPLWDINLVYGLEGGRTAMICRVHHCMVDGVSGVDLLKIVLDFTPEPAPVPPKRAHRRREPKPDPARQLFDSILGGMQEGMNRWLEFQNGLLNLTQALTGGSAREKAGEMTTDLSNLTVPVWPMPFNGMGSGERLFVWNTFSFAEARSIRGALNGTVNDVVLTALSGAVARYVAGHGRETAGRTVRVMVPVSLRQESQHGALGNLISLLPIEIPLDIPDPIERFRYINRKTTGMKQARVAEGLNIFSALLGMLPASLQSFVGSISTGSLPLPPVNIISTNVPGPQVPLYALGRKMVAYYPYVPIGFGIGCGCAIMSYDQNLYFGLSADAQSMPDVAKLSENLDESFHELRVAAGVEEIRPRVMKAAAGRSARSRVKKDAARGDG